MDNMKKLAAAGLVNEKEVSEQDKSMIESLSPQEVDSLISINAKVHKAGYTKAAAMMAPKLI
jgi:hypothetical protein